MQIRLSKTLHRHIELGSLEAKRSGNPQLITDIAFLSIIKEGMSHAGHILRKLLKDWEIYQLRIRIEREAAKSAPAKTQDGNIISPDEALSSVMAGVATMCVGAKAIQSKNIPTTLPVANTGHFLLWIIANKEYISSRALELYGVTAGKVNEYLTQMPPEEDYYIDMAILDRLSKQNLLSYEMPSARHNDGRDDDFSGPEEHGTDDNENAIPIKSKSRSKSMLDQFGVNLSHQAAGGEIDPVIGREQEIERLIQILGRRKKNNPILIGEAGVGKSAIVEGLALRIESGEVPQSLRDKEIFSLDVASLVAGTKYRGEFEERIKGLLKELQKNRKIILFIDEIHTIAGAGSTQGSLDTANILKPALARGELQCIGATTLDEYRENIESDSALERRFQKIIVEPTTREQTLTILHNIKPHYEEHHCVRYTDEALRACVELTERYVTDRHFPDKAIDVLDEAGSKAKLFHTEEPTVIRELQQSIAAAEREKAGIEEFGSAAEMRAKIMALRSRLRECRNQWERELEQNPFVVGEDHIAEVITSMTGVPADRVSQNEKKRLHGMDAHLSAQVIGQDTAVSKVVKSIQRSRTGLKDPRKPIGVFMFVGPTGVGKTHLAKELSRWMFDKDDALIRVDMSEYSEKHNVSRMIGSPPGYVGYNEGGQLTEAVRRQPYAVILFDEIEKAHPDVFNIMLQIFDEGQLTDGNGRKVDFRNTVIIMTSNVGSREVAKRPPMVGYTTYNKERIETYSKESGYRSALEHTFAPEFINRIDDIVIFNTLCLEDVERIVDLELSELDTRTVNLGYRMKVTPRARKLLAEMGYDPRYGVRSLKRTILDAVEEPIAQLIVSEELAPGDTIRIDGRKKAIEVSRQASLAGKKREPELKLCHNVS